MERGAPVKKGGGAGAGVWRWGQKGAEASTWAAVAADV